VNNNTIATANMQAGGSTTGLKKKKSSKSKKKKSTRPKLRPVDTHTLPSVNEDDDNLERDGLGYGDILVVPPPTPRDKLFSDLHRLERDITTLPKFTDEWFGVKAELAVVQMKLDDWDNSTPTAKGGRMETPIVTTNAAYQDIIKHISNEEEEVQQPVVNKQKKKSKKSSRKKNRPKLTPQSVEKKEEGDEEEGLGFNDILLTKKQSNKAPVVVVDEQTTLLVDGGGSTVEAPQPQSNVVGDWLLRGVIGTLFCFVVFKFLLP